MILVLGADGMLGRAVTRTLRRRRLDVVGTQRAEVSASELPHRIQRLRPARVVNCIGIVKQRLEAQDPVESIRINALLPHEIAAALLPFGQLIHVSTDCVFSGAERAYRESDPPDADDLYGRTKALGEVSAPHLTLRTSIVGRERRDRPTRGLLEWFLAQPDGGEVKGFTRALWSGVSTDYLAGLIGDVIDDRFGALAGLYHVATPPLSKAQLLAYFNELRVKLGQAPLRITPTETPCCDRTLDATKLKQHGWTQPSWPELLETIELE